MSGTVVAIEKEDYHPSKKVKKIVRKVVVPEDPKYKKAGKGGKCKKCGEKMEVKHVTPMGEINHVTYWCRKCGKPRVGMVKQ
jgi:hypothetical protein